MANSWYTNPIILDTAANDTTYDSDNDIINGGTEYSTLDYTIQAISVIGAANADDIKLIGCGTSDVTGAVIYEVVAETGDLQKTITFPKGLHVAGLYPATLDNSSKLAIYVT